MARSLRIWLSLGLSALVALAIASLVAALLGVLLPRLNAEVEAKNRALGAAATSEIETFLDNARSDLERLAIDIEAQPKFDPDRLRLMVDTHANTDVHLDAIYVVDASDRVIEVGLPIARRALRSDLVDADFSARSFVQAARQSRHSIWSDTYLSQRGGIVVAVALPMALPGPHGVVTQALLVGELSLKEVSRFARQMGRSGNVLPIIVDRRGQIVGHPNDGRSLRQENISQVALLHAPSGTQSQTAQFRLDDIDYIGTTTPIRAVGWTTLIAEPTGKAFAIVRYTLLALAVASLVAFGFALVAAFLVSRRVSRQVAEFGHQMQLISAGNYQVFIPRSATDEIEDLAQSMRRMAATVLERESRLRLAASVFESSVEGIMITDARRRIISVNPVLLSITGFSADELIGKRPFILGSAHHDRSFFRGVWASVKTEGFWRGELFGQRKSGEVFPQAVTMTAVRNGAGPITHYVASLFDITERKHAEKALTESESRFRTLIEWSPEPVLVLREKKLIYVNPAAVTLLGAKSAQNLIGRSIFELVHPDFHETVKRRVGQLMEGDTAVPMMEQKFLRLDGATIDVEVQSRNITYDGQPAIQVAMRDVTERKAAEDQLRKLSKAIEQSSDSIVITDINGKIEYVNQAFVENTGYSREAAIGQNPRILQSGKTPAETYTTLWETLISGKSWSGEFNNQRKDGSEYFEFAVISPIREQDGSITHYVAVKTDITERKAAENRIENLVFYDTLTSLPNRRLLLDRLEQALIAGSRRLRQGALLFIDLDDFKSLNDTLGHDQGDLLLQQVSERLQTCLREGDTVARVGGDEFVALLEDLSQNPQEAATQAEAVAKKMIAALNQPYPLGSHVQHSTSSIGITLFGGALAEAIAEPLKRAELAMYQAKAAGRNTLRFFEVQMQAAVMAHAALEIGLRQALEKRQFLVHYQAQISGERQITGVEALVRWQDPLRGMVSPAEFIPLAEETGLILPLGQWVLETACTQLARWAKRPEMAHLSIAVNVSARQFHQGDFVDQVLAALERTGANPNRLKLELTESLLVTNIEGVIAKMSALKGGGVCFSLDDFGTGYSSLSYLKRLPIDQLKIDQGFVRDILIDTNDAAIAKMVVALAQSLGLEVIAEGVETEAQRNFLAGLGCHAFQGYLFSRPLPIAEFEAFATRF